MEKRKSLRPRVKFVIKDFESTCVDICDNFFRNDQRLNGMHALKVAEQFDIDVNQLKGKTIEEKYAIVKGKILPVYERNFDLMKRKVDEYQRLWNKYEKRIQRNFQDIFNLEYTGDREVLGQVNINVVCPRYYSNWSFDIGVNKFDIGALTTPIHELTHFFWFDLWKEVFPNWTNSDFCAPSLAWGFLNL